MDFLAASEFLIVVGKVFCFALSILLIVLVLLQKEKGGGLAGAFGGSGSIATFGVKTSDVASKITWWIFGLWLATSLSLALLTKHSEDNITEASSPTPVETSQETDS